MLRQRPFLIEILTAVGLIAAPLILPHLGFTPTTINRILVWGLFGIGFDLLFGFTGLLSFGQSAFFGTGGMVAAYLLTVLNFPTSRSRWLLAPSSPASRAISWGLSRSGAPASTLS